jgi:uncharacterized protein YtpQ (UPF0354 family)
MLRLFAGRFSSFDHTMGNCLATPEEKFSDSIDDVLTDEHTEESRVIKLLLLGKTHEILCEVRFCV